MVAIKLRSDRNYYTYRDYYRPKPKPQTEEQKKRAQALELAGIGEPVVKQPNETVQEAVQRSANKTATTFGRPVTVSFTQYETTTTTPNIVSPSPSQTTTTVSPTKTPIINTFNTNVGALNTFFSQVSDTARQKREVAAINAYKDYTYRIESSINRRNEFFSSDGFKRIETTATDTNKFLRNAFKYTPIGYVADKTGISPKGGLLDKTGVEIGKTSYGLGIGLGGALPTIGENIAASIDAATIGKYTGDQPITYYLNANEKVVINNPNPKNKVGNFYGQGLVDVEKTSFNFLPFGTPIDEKGLTTLAFIGFGAGQLTVNPQFKANAPLKSVENNIQIGGGKQVQVRPSTRGIVGLRGTGNLPKGTIVSSPDYVGRIINVKGYTRTTSPTTIKYTTFGVDIGSRSLPFYTYGGGKFFLGTPKGVGIAPSTLAKSTPFPATSLGGAAFRKIIDFTPAEQARITSAIKIGRITQSEKGLPVKSFELNIEGLKNPKATTEATQNFINQEKGVIFGSLTTKQLPEGLQNIKIGDVDVIFPQRTVAQLEQPFIKFAETLRGLGENVQVSPKNPRVIEFKGTGEKFLEGKAKNEPAAIDEFTGLVDEVPTGVAGLKFPDLKSGNIGKIRSFGDTKSIRIGEQNIRKAAGALITSPALGGETPSFSVAGLLGKQGNPRGLKDVAGFIQTSEGIAVIKQGKFSPVQQYKGAKVADLTKDFFKTYTKEQQKDILVKVQDITGTRLTFGSPSSFKTNSVVGKSTIKFLSDYRPNPYSKEPIYNLDFGSPITSPKPFVESPSSFSPSLIKSPSISAFGSPSSFSPSPSRYSSPSGFSPSPSPSIITSPSIIPSPSTYSSPSTFTSPSSISPRPSVYTFPSPFDKPNFVKQPTYNRPPSLNFNSDFGGAFKVEVRRGGVFRQVSGAGLPFNKAIKLGAAQVQNSAAASFRLIGTAGKEVSTGKALQKLGNTFYGSKKERNVFIQKNTFRISSIGEKQQITFKGIQASKNKRRNNLLRGIF